ncbi:aminotransferase class I/II-fold pyridoxal phosphate-dependent enzyme [Candidatus Nitrosocosmicus arcticus]|uniref:Aminotransferase n=1 Tax=Candidatus Nitrosocosmicus arcticus TaxID=2035267 RepID=A0A557SYG5_9ARCH|nr:aminotransferase class I/II-fold pyridoxal phosphate-dependent enzyme [Candidatus Nitrosocosmicus arcticus]TVP41641.1 Aspartate aminotransferase [Candidatus Nitrosocosmicus arcticus]
MSIEEVNILRNDMKEITNQIMKLVNQRMEIARKIGTIKTNLDLDIIDDKVELGIKSYLFSNSKYLNLDPEFSGRIVNMLINESIRIQKLEKNQIKVSQEKMNPTNNSPAQFSVSTVVKNDNGVHKFEIKSHLDVFNAAKNLELQGFKIIHMEVGEPDFLPPIEVKNELAKIYEMRKFHYTQTAGIKDLRIGLSNYISEFSTKNGYDIFEPIDPNKIIVTPGGRFGIFCAFSALLSPGDEIITIEPAWPACNDCANYLGVKTRIVKTNLEQNWEPDISEIENQININTKIICLNYPNNPTGKILSNKTHKKIIDIAREKDIYVLSDEVYSNYAYKPFQSVINFDYDKSILVGSFSKTFAMTGLRVGYAYSRDNQLINKIIKIQALALTSVAEPMQFCALGALNSDPENNNRTIQKRLDIMCKYLKKLPFEFTLPEGAMYVFARISNDLNLTDLKLVELLLNHGVAVAPGSGFGSNYSNYIRLSTCLEEKKMNEGLEIISNLVGKL